MDPKKVLDTLHKLGIPIAPHTAVIALVAVPLVLLAGAWLWKRRARLFSRPGLRKRVAPPGEATLGISGNQLRATWRRFMRTLPRTYRRSILSFDHFVVLGDASSGKSLVIDRYTDFRRQAKEFLGSHVFDSYIDLYIGSRTVVMELAPSVLLDIGPKCRTALERLWRPLYRRCAPSVVLVVDLERLTRPDFDIVDYAERLRGKVNLLSGICKRALEVRVVLTHLDTLPGYEQFAQLCGEEKIPLFIPISPKPDLSLESQLDAWVVHVRDHLGRALVKRGASNFRACIAFLRETQRFPKPLAKFFDTLLAPTAFSETPRAGGVYLATAEAYDPNPLQGKPPGQLAPDPRVRHKVFAYAAAVVVLAYLGTAFAMQRTVRRDADGALATYVPVTRERDSDRALRATILKFACKGCGPIARVPDYFGEERQELREHFATRVRDELLIPNLRKVARDGYLTQGSLENRLRRSLFYLALIHGDRSDPLRVRADRKRLQSWADMTELPPQLIEMYLDATAQPYTETVDFELPERNDPRDLPPYWLSLMNDISKRMADAQAIRAEELKDLQDRAADAARALKRFEHDDLVEKILNMMLGSGTRDALANHNRYKLQFEVFAAARKDFDPYGHHKKVGAIADVLQTIRASYVDSPDVPQVAALADRLSSLYETPTSGGTTEPQVIAIADQKFSFDPARWGVLVRNAQASAIVADFMRHDAGDRSVFIPAAAADSLSPVRWNATNDGSAILVGRAEISPAYTRAGYDALVREPVQKLERALEVVSIPRAQKGELEEHVKRNVRSYAIEYKRQLKSFFDSFGLATPSAESLRVAVAQMAAEESPYSAYLHAVHRQVDIDTSGSLLDGMTQALREYAGLRQLFDHAGAEGEVGKYRAILTQLLQDLGKPGETTGAADADPTLDASRETLENSLSQAGKVALSSVRADKGSYTIMIREWHASLGLRPALLGPFLAPIFELERIGLRDTKHLLARAWKEQVAPDVQRISQKFPFDTHDYAEDVNPQELDALVNPSTGRVASFVRRYLTPLADPRSKHRFRMRDVVESRIELPPRMLTTISAAEQLADRLYDAKDRPKPLTLQIATVPFEHGIDPRFGLTLVYLSVGEASINNFNQRPGLTTLRVDWTREQISQVGIQLMNLDTQEKLFPEPLATPSSSWSVLRLLSVAKVSPVKKPENAQLYTWQVRHQPGGGRSTPVRFVVLGDPFALFTLGVPDQTVAWTGRLR